MKQAKQIGYMLTYLITFPFLGFLFFGVTGAVIGFILGLGLFGNTLQKEEKNK